MASGKWEYSPGKRADPVGRSVYDNADDVHMFLFIWKSHSSDNIGAVIVKDLVDLPHSLFIFYNDSHYCDSCFLFHNLLLLSCRKYFFYLNVREFSMSSIHCEIVLITHLWRYCTRVGIFCYIKTVPAYRLFCPYRRNCFYFYMILSR